MFARILGGVGRTLIILGLLILGFVAFQLWGTGLETARGQDELADSLASTLGDDTDAATLDVSALADRLAETDPQTAPPMPAPPEGEPVGVISIPKIGVENVIVEGVSKADLKKGPGHYPGTPLPGQAGNSGIAGHRTTYGAPFNRIDELVPGDEIVVVTPQGGFTYEVIPGPQEDGQAWYAVSPKDVSVLDDMGDNRLTLTACHPKYSARQRIIVNAVLKEEPAAAAPTTTVAPAQGESASAQTVDELDEGLGGDSSALLPALAFFAAAIALGLLAWFVGRHWRRWIVYLAATPGVLVLVWFGYVQLDKYLPAL